MARELADALAAGALGFATSRGVNHRDAYQQPVPSRFADDDELRALVAQCRDRIWQINLASKFGNDANAMTEEVGAYASWTEAAGARLTWSPLFVDKTSSVWREALTHSRALNDRVVVAPQINPTPITTSLRFDRPSIAVNVKGWHTPVTELLALPESERVSRVTDPSFASALRRSELAGPGLERRYDDWIVSWSRSRPELAGRSLASCAAATGEHPVDFLCRLAVADELETELVVPVFNDGVEEIADCIVDPATLLGLGDSGAHVMTITNYSYPTYLLGTLVRDRQLVRLESAVEQMTRRPAELFGIPSRGALTPGMAADVCVIDLDNLSLGARRVVGDLPGGAHRLFQDAARLRGRVRQRFDDGARRSADGPEPGIDDPPPSGVTTVDARELLDRARAETGFDDFGGAHVEQSIENLASRLRDADLEPTRLAGARAQIHRALVNCLLFGSERSMHPGIDAEVIERPVFVVGSARSGTTLLHALLAEDPARRAPRWWELARPSPPPGAARSDDPRISAGDRDVKELLDFVPGLLQLHPYWDAGGLALMEDEALPVLEFRTAYPTAWYRVPFVGDGGWLVPAEPSTVYTGHRRVLQHLQWGAEPRGWALKGTLHTVDVNLAALLETYPDAVCVWVHRDPVRVQASLMEMAATFASALYGPVDRSMFGRGALAETSMFRLAPHSPFLEDPRVHHVRYQDLVDDPYATISALYDRAGLECSDDYAARLRAYLTDPAHGAGRHGEFRYSLDDFGLTHDELAVAFAEYRERFDVAET